MSGYPDKLPKEQKPLDKFTFSLSASSEMRSKLQSEFDTIQSRLDRIFNEVLLDGVPILRFILQTSENKKELKKLAKALDRVADLIEHQNSINAKLTIINQAHKDPSWFALAFGDFSQEIDNDIDSILNLGE